MNFRNKIYWEKEPESTYKENIRTMASQMTTAYYSFPECLFSNTFDREQERDEVSRYYDHHQKLSES